MSNIEPPQSRLHPWAEQYLRSLLSTNSVDVSSGDHIDHKRIESPERTLPFSSSTGPSAATTSLLLRKLKCKSTLFSRPVTLAAARKAEDTSAALTQKESSASPTERKNAQSARDAVTREQLRKKLLQSLYLFVEQQPHYLKQTRKRTELARAAAEQTSRDYSSQVASASSFYVSLTLLPVTVLRRTLLFFLDHVPVPTARLGDAADEAAAAEERLRLETMLASPPLRLALAHFVVQVLANEKLQQKMRTPLWSLLAQQHQQLLQRWEALTAAAAPFLQEAFDQSAKDIAAELLALPKELLFEEHPVRPSLHTIHHETEGAMQEGTEGEAEALLPIARSANRVAALPFTLYTCERGEHFHFTTTSPKMARFLRRCQEARFQTLFTSRREGSGSAVLSDRSGSASTTGCFTPIRNLRREVNENTAAPSSLPQLDSSSFEQNEAVFARAFVPLLCEMCQIRLCVAFLLELELVWRTARTLQERGGGSPSAPAPGAALTEVERMALLRRVFHLVQQRHVGLLLSATHHSKRFQKKFSMETPAARADTPTSAPPVRYKSVQALFQDFRTIMKRERKRERNSCCDKEKVEVAPPPKPTLVTSDASTATPFHKDHCFYTVDITKEQHHREEEEVVTCTRANTKIPWPLSLQFATPAPNAAGALQPEEARVRFTLKPFKSFYAHWSSQQPEKVLQKNPFSPNEKLELRELQNLLQQKHTLVRLWGDNDRASAVRSTATRPFSEKVLREVWHKSVRIRFIVR